MNATKLSIIFIATCVLFWASISTAEDNVEVLETIEVESSRSLTPSKNIITSHTIISKEEIAKKQYQHVEGILRGELGLDVFRNGPAGGLTTVLMRGASSNSTLVMLDGIQLNNSFGGGFDFSNLTVENIERIEIYRGPQSPLWGADGVGGVINIITKTGKGDPQFSLSFEGGSFGTFKELGTASGSLEDFDYSLSLSRTDSDGFSAANGSGGGIGVERDGYDNTSASVRFGYDLPSDTRVEFIGRYIRSFSDIDVIFGSFSTDSKDTSKQTSYFASLPIQKTFSDWWHVKIKPSIAYNQRFTFQPMFMSNNHVNSGTYTLDAQNILELGPYNTTTIGYEHQTMTADNKENNLFQTIRTDAFFINTAFNYNDFAFLSGGYRRDNNSAFESADTYKVEAALRIEQTGTRIRGSYNTGFRAPTIRDLFFPGCCGFPPSSNINLVPEKTKGWEAGIDQTFFEDLIDISVTYFDMEFEDLIQLGPTGVFVNVGTPAFPFLIEAQQLQNVSNATSRGVETEINIQPNDDLLLSLKHTWNETYDNMGFRLNLRPENKFTATLTHNWRNKLSTLVSVTFRDEIEKNIPTGTFTVVRAAISYKLNNNVKFTARGENLLDDDYEEIKGFNTAGISGYFGFTLTSD
jgi:vitamin B12 transporter